jgi:flagellar motor switch protein FliM
MAADEFLDQKEVDALLAAVERQEIVEEKEAGKPPQRIAPYDFKRPERVSKEQMRSLEMLHEQFCRKLSASLSVLLRTIVEIRTASVDQLTYQEFIMSLPDPTCFNLLSCAPLEGNMILEMNPSIVYPIIDRRLGGGKTGTQPLDRPFTEIEWQLTKGVTDRVLEELSSVWSQIRPIQFLITASESKPGLMPIVPQNELVVLVSFDVTMGEARGLMNLCIPFVVIEPIIGEITSHSWFAYARKGPGVQQGASIRRHLNTAEVPLTCYLAETTITVRDLLAMEPGDIIETPTRHTSPLVLCIEGKPKFFVRAGQFRRHKAVRIERPIPKE